jgi:hypothetical protein
MLVDLLIRISRRSVLSGVYFCKKQTLNGNVLKFVSETYFDGVNMILLKNEQLVSDVKLAKEPKEQMSKITRQGPAPQPRRLDMATTRSCLWRSSAGCINGIYHTVGNLFLSGAFAGAAVLTVADLNDRQKDAVGGLTMALIFVSGICFWNLACCPQKTQRSISDSSYSGFQSMSERGEYQRSDTEPEDSVSI